MGDDEILSAMQENVESGLARVDSISELGPAWKLTDRGRERARRIIAATLGLSFAEFSAVPEPAAKRLEEIAVWLVANDMSLENIPRRSKPVSEGEK